MGFLKSVFGTKDDKPVCVVVGDRIKLSIGDIIEFNKYKYQISRISKLKEMCYNQPNTNLYVIFGIKEK